MCGRKGNVLVKLMQNVTKKKHISENIKHCYTTCGVLGEKFADTRTSAAIVSVSRVVAAAVVYFILQYRTAYYLINSNNLLET